MWRAHVIVPLAAQVKLLDILHSTHPDMSRDKGLARSYVWWPGMDAELEARVRERALCQDNQKALAKAPLHPWD